MDRSAFPVTGAVPLSEGALPLPEVERLELRSSSGDTVPLQAGVTGRWPDGSVKWLLLDFPVDVAAGEAARFELVRGQGTPGASPMGRAGAGEVQVDTGAIVGRFADGKLTIHRSGDRGAVLVEDVVSHVETQDRNGGRQSYALRMGQAELELNGPRRAVVKVTGWHASADDQGQYSPSVIRYVFYRDQPLVRVYHTFVVSGNPREFLLGDVSLRVQLVETMDRASVLGRSQPAALSGPVSVFQENRYEPRYPEHKHAREFEGHYEARIDGQVVAEGQEYEGAVTLGGEAGGLSVFVKDFWQLSPKALAYDPGQGELYVGLCPGKFAAPLDLMRTELREPEHWRDYVQAESDSWGKFSPTYVPHNRAHSAMGMSRTHEIVLRFDEAGEPAEPETLVKLFSVPTVPFVSGEWNMATGAVGELVTPRRYPEYDAITTAMTDLVIESIEEGGWYGLMTHGNVHYGWDKGCGCWMKYSPKWGWYHAGHMMNGGTMPQVLWHQYLRTGRPDYYELAEARSRQVEDLSVLHYHDDETLIGGMLRHGGPDPWIGSRSRHGAHSPLGGIPLHHYVTGYEHAADVTHLVGQKIYQHKDFNHSRSMDTDMANMVLYYQFTGEERYLERAKEYLDYYYRTRDEASQQMTFIQYFATALRWFYDMSDDPQVRQGIREVYLMRFDEAFARRQHAGNPEMAAFAWQLDPTEERQQVMEETLTSFYRSGTGQIGWYDNMLLKSPNEYMLATAMHYALRQLEKATADVVDAPRITPEGGTFGDSVAVELSTPQPGARIVYTTDGATPDENSPEYEQPITIDSTTTLQARALADGKSPSTVTQIEFVHEPVQFSRDGLQLWLRADRGVDVGDDGRVEAWRDQSGQGRHALPLSNWSDPPFFVENAAGDKPAVRAEGDQSLQLYRLAPLFGDGTLLFLAAFGAGEGGEGVEGRGYSGSLVGDDDEGHIALGDMPNAQLNVKFSATGDGATIGLQQPYQPGTFAIWTLIREGGRLRLYRDGELQGEASARTETFNISALLTQRSWGVNGFRGQLAEMLIYNRALPDDERTEVEQAVVQP